MADLASLEHLVEDLARVVPTLAAEIRRLRDSWEQNVPPTLLMSSIGKAYVRDLETTPEESQLLFFSKIEQALAEGDERMKNLITTGLLEAVVSEAFRCGVDRDSVIGSYAGPMALDYIAAWDDFSGE